MENRKMSELLYRFYLWLQGRNLDKETDEIIMNENRRWFIRYCKLRDKYFDLGR